MPNPSKGLRPSVPPWYVPRAAVEKSLGEALSRRVTTVVAGAGFGKSSVLSAWAADVPSAWYTLDPSDEAVGTFARGLIGALRVPLPGLPDILARDGAWIGRAEGGGAESVAGHLSEVIQRELRTDLAIVLDDLHELRPGSDSMGLIEAMLREAPGEVHFVLSSRERLPFRMARLQGQGQVLTVEPSVLAFDPDEVAEVLRASVGIEDRGLASRLHEMTAGWPAAIRLAVESLRAVPGSDHASAIERLRSPEGPLFAYLAEEIYARESEDARELLRLAARFDRFRPELCRAVGVRSPEDAIASLSSRGLFIQPAGEGWLTLHALVRSFALEHLPLPHDELREVRRRAADWFEEHGYVESALDELAGTGDAAELVGLLRRRGEELLHSGAVGPVLRAVEQLPESVRDAGLDELVGEALQIRGDWEGARTCFRRAAGNAESLAPSLAWRAGALNYLQGDPQGALAEFERGRVDGSDPRNESLLLAWTATAHCMLQSLDACRSFGLRALAIAEDTEDPRALATAHTVMALSAWEAGDRRAADEHHDRALRWAEAAGDVIQIVRVRTNRASNFTERGAYRDALEELEAAIPLAELSGFDTFLALALSNRGETRYFIGQLDEAVLDLEASRAIYGRLASPRVCYPLTALGDVHRERGDLAQARICYEEAARVAEIPLDPQGLVPALAGLARVVAAEEPVEAARLADRAVELGEGFGYVAALLSAGWVALVRGDRESASERSREAAAAARARGELPGLAESIELEVVSADDPKARIDRLEEALVIWRQVGNGLGEAKAEYALAAFSGGAVARAMAGGARRRLEALGVRIRAAAAGAGLLSALPPEQEAPVAIRALGGFRVIRDGGQVPLADWQSKKARDLLKVLVARRGRSTPREMLMEILWPEELPDRLSHRLSVAIATVRAVLDPDHCFDTDRFVVADREAVAVNLDALPVDVEAFMEQARAGVDLARKHPSEEAVHLLESAEGGYTGEFLEEDLYEDWAAALREEARAAYIAVARTLAGLSATGGDHDRAIRLYLRVLEQDPYDEEAHLRLVAVLERSGRHGEARRRYRLYASRMQEIEVEAVSLPAAVRA